MGKVMNAVKRAVGVEPEAPADPAVIDVRALYIEAAKRLAEALELGNTLAAAQHTVAVRSVRQLAHREGLAASLDALWVEPPPDGAAMAGWYRAALAHVLDGGEDPGERPALPYEWPTFRERYRAAIARVAQAYRTRAPDTDWVVGAMHIVRREAIGAGHAFKAEAHFQPTNGGHATADDWEAEALFRLDNGRSSGNYRPAPPPQPFVRASDFMAAQHSAVVLLGAFEDQPLGARVTLDAGTSWELVERGAATWCDPAAVPTDPRPPVDEPVGADWLALLFLRSVRLRSRHEMTPGVVRPVPPEEAAELVEAGAAEPWLPPPPPPPRPRVTFGAE